MNAPYAVIGEAISPTAKPSTTQQPSAVPPGELWRLPTVLIQFPVSRREWYRGVADGRYPRPVSLTGGRAVAWRATDVMQLVHSRLSSGG